MQWQDFKHNIKMTDEIQQKVQQVFSTCRPRSQSNPLPIRNIRKPNSQKPTKQSTHNLKEQELILLLCKLKWLRKQRGSELNVNELLWMELLDCHVVAK